MRQNAPWSVAFCWIGAVLDAVATAALLSPTLAQVLLGVGDVPRTAALDYAMRTGASLMLGWTCLLMWASWHPALRHGVIALTLVPVLAGLVATELIALRAGFLPLASAARLVTVQVLLGGLGAFSLIRERRAPEMPADALE